MSDTKVSVRPYVIGSSATSFVVPEAPAYTGPGDLSGLTGFTYFYGVRAVNAAYAANVTKPALDLHDDATGTFYATINILSTGGLDTAAAAAAIAAGKSKVGKWYDQSVNAMHITQATNSVRPVLALNGAMGYAVFFTHGNPGTYMTSGLAYTVAAPFSVSTVVKTTAAAFQPNPQYGTGGGHSLCFWNQLTGTGDIALKSGVGRTDANYLGINLNMQNIYDTVGYIYLNGSAGASIGNTSDSCTSDGLAMGDDGSGSNTFAGYMHEWGAWSGLSFGIGGGGAANLLDLNQKAYYGTY